jgi:hypothetical protein
MAAEFSGGHPRIYRRMIKRPNQSLIHIIRKKPECSRKDAKPTDVFPIGGGIPFERTHALLQDALTSACDDLSGADHHSPAAFFGLPDHRRESSDMIRELGV